MNITAPRPDETVAILQADFTNCWIPIAQTTLAAPAASVTFAGIPQNFRTLALVVQARTDKVNTFDTIYWRANGDGGANYDSVNVYGNNGAAGSGSTLAGAGSALIAICDAANSRASCFGGCLAIFPDYRNASLEKQAWSISGNVGTPTAATIYAILYNSHWRSTAAITSLAFYPSTGPNFVASSTFQLYGIL